MGALDWIKHKCNQTCGLPFVAAEGSPRQQQYLPFTKTRGSVGGGRCKVVFQMHHWQKWHPGFFDPVSLFTPSNEITFSTCYFYFFSCVCNPPISKVKQPECSSLQGAILATRRREDQCPACNMSFSCTTWRVSYIHPSRVLADSSSCLWSQNERLWSCSVGNLLHCLQM